MRGGQVLRRAVRRNGRRLALGSFLIGCHQVCEVAVPILIGVAIDRAVATGDVVQLVIWISAFAVLFTVLNFCFRTGARVLLAAIAEESHQLRLEVARKIMHPRGIRTDFGAGDLLSISTTDADHTSYLLDQVPRVIGALVATVVSATAMLLISVPLGLIVLLVTPLVLVGLQLGGPRITRRIGDQQQLIGRATALATDLVTGLRPLRGVGAQDAAAARYRTISGQALRATLFAAKAQGVYRGLANTVSTLLACAVAIVAGWFALTGRITAGQFITVIGLAQFLLEPLGTLSLLPAWIAQSRASADRVGKVLGAEQVLPVPVDRPLSTAVELRLTGVSGGSLRSVDLVLRPGEFVGLVARRPSDAEALTGLLSGTDPATGGEVSLGGEPLHATDGRELLLVEPHHNDLFTGTIRSNLLVVGTPALRPSLSGTPVPDQALFPGREPVAPTTTPGGGVPAEQSEAISSALRASAADEVVEAHADGLDHAVAERGTTLSGGQRQRLALARALLAKTPLLVLHDPTTAVDAVTEHSIAQGIRALRHGPGSAYGTLVITSSPALLAQTDRVVVLDDGEVAAVGDHAGLGATDERYRAAVLR